jgi:hypothetical protein
MRLGGDAAKDRLASVAVAKELPSGCVLPQDVATDGVREASQSHASDSPSPGEGRESPNGPAIGEEQFWPSEARYRMVEVKGPGDRLQDNQRRFLEFCAGHQMPVFVCQVRGREAVKLERDISRAAG